MASLQERIYFSLPIWAQNIAISAYGLRLYKKRYTGIYRQIRENINHLRSMSPLQVKSYQEERLHHLVSHCALNVPYYRKIFSDFGLTPQSFTSIEDLQKLPILEKQTLQQDPDAFRAFVREKPYFIQKTSGSTGTPLILGVNEYSYKLAMALLVDHEEKHGVAFGAKRATFAGRMVQPQSVITPPFSRYNRAENQRLFSSYHLNSETFPQYCRELDKFRPEEIIGYPSAISDLATYYLENNTRPQFRPKLVVTNSETLLAWQRERIEAVFECKVRDYYGTAEYVIFAGEDDDGLYRTNPLIGISELVPIEHGGQPGNGRVIATTLCNTCMPLLRYDTGDTAEENLKSVNENGVLTISRFYGRRDDYILTVDGRKIGRIDHIFKGVEGIREAQVIQEQANLCRIKLVQTKDKDFSREKLLQNFHERLGTSMGVELEFVDSIPRGKNGKFKSVVGLQ